LPELQALRVKLTRRTPGMGELEVYFHPAVAMEEKIIFSKYVHEYLLQHARDVERLRHYACPQCGTSLKGWRQSAQGCPHRGLPWVTIQKTGSTLKGLHQDDGLFNPFRVVGHSRPPPRVVAPRQPWADGLNAVGVRTATQVGRFLPA
jgi:hypothetical protein